MRKVIITTGLLVGVAAWAVGIIGLLATPNPHLLPIPDRVSAFGVTAMLGTTVLLVIVLAHTTRAGDID